MTIKELKALLASSENDDVEISSGGLNKIQIPSHLERGLATTNQIPIPEGTFKVKHSVNLGDLIAAMAACKTIHDTIKRKVIVAQHIGTLAAYYQGATHPTQNQDGQHVCMNQAMFDMVKPLIESQEYIHSFEEYTGQDINVDFDKIRGEIFVNLPQGMIQAWLYYCYPDTAYDLSKPWIFIDDSCPEHISTQARGKIVLNFTERYRGPFALDYHYLKNYASELVFAGTDKEHFLFCNAWKLNIPRLEVKDFLEYAYALKVCRFFLSNQSFGWNLAEAMKIPRILEVCSFAQNCMPFIGEKSYGFFHQGGSEYFFRRLYNETASK